MIDFTELSGNQELQQKLVEFFEAALRKKDASYEALSTYYNSIRNAAKNPNSFTSWMYGPKSQTNKGRKIPISATSKGRRKKK